MGSRQGLGSCTGTQEQETSTWTSSNTGTNAKWHVCVCIGGEHARATKSTREGSVQVIQRSTGNREWGGKGGRA